MLDIRKEPAFRESAPLVRSVFGFETALARSTKPLRGIPRTTPIDIAECDPEAEAKKDKPNPDGEEVGRRITSARPGDALAATRPKQCLQGPVLLSTACVGIKWFFEPSSYTCSTKNVT